MSVTINTNKSSKQSSYRPEIDGLRAFAVITVIINHFNKNILPGGYLGVDIFFVISGFVITSSLYKRPSKNFKDFISGFYERRIRRLIPALSIFVLITSISICLFNQNPGLSLKTGITSLFGLSNIFLFQRSTDYFAQSTELNVGTHTWSLGVEEQFYILYPLIFWFSGFARQTKNSARNLFLIVGALTIASLIAFIYLYQTNQPAAYFLMPTRFWEIASGCLLFIGFQKRKSIEQFLERVPPILVMALIIGVMYLPMSLGTTSTIAVVVLSLVLIASLKKGTTLYKFFTNSRVVYIGLISYSLYLWHWGVLSISRWTIGVHWWSLPFQVALIFSLAIASYQYIETPLRKGIWFGKRWKTFFLGAGMIVILSSGLIALGKPLKGQLYTGKKRIEILKPKIIQGNKCLENVSTNVLCYFMDNKSKQTLWILGDSHAHILNLAGEKVANSLGKNLKLYAVNATPFPPIDRYQKKIKKNDLKRFNDQKYIQKELYRQIKVNDVIFLSIRLPDYFGGTYYIPKKDYGFFRKDGYLLSQKNQFNNWISEVLTLAKMVQTTGAKVIIQTPTPEWEKELNKSCSIKDKQWFNSLNKTNCQIKSKFFIDKEKGLYKHLFENLNRLANSHENIYLFDTYKIVCPESVCRFTKNGIDIYNDDDHISSGWARDFLSPEIYKLINAIQIADK